MKQKTIPFALIFFSFLFSCQPKQNATTTSQKDTTTEKASLDKLTILQNLLDRKNSFLGDNDAGQEIKMSYIKPCLDVYPGEMKKYSFDESEHDNTTPVPAKTRKYTLSEAFNGSNLLEWLTKVVNLYDPSGKGKNMEIRVEPGILDAALIRDNTSNDQAHRDKINRIAFFLVCYVKTEDNKYTRMDGPQDLGFELGGVQP